MLLRGFIVSFFLLISFPSFSQLDSVQAHVRTFAAIGNKGYAPHWIVSNRSGIFNDSINDFAVMPGFLWPVRLGKHFRVEAGFDLAIKAKLKQTFLYQAYLNLSFGSLKLTAGRQEYTLGQYGDSLSSGSFLISKNARAIPKIGMGFYDYVNVPFTQGYLQVKGAASLGFLDDDRFHHSPITKPLIHEKFAYLRTQKIPVNPYIGIGHVVLFGGEFSDGKKVDIDLLSVFLARGSNKVSLQGEALNAVGEHLGILDLGLTMKLKNWSLTYFHQKPITDHSGYSDNFSRNYDFFSGVVIENPKSKLISGIIYEMVQTEHQGGLGIPDPWINGRMIVPSRKDDIEFLKDYYGNLGYPVTGLETGPQWIEFLKAYSNYGYDFGGRDNYYNNYLYEYVYKDRVIGTPLFLTKNELRTFSGYIDSGRFVVNNRITAHHLGVKGSFGNNIKYRFLLTYTRNMGAWQEYGGGTKWEGIANNPNYEWFWKGKKSQWYSLLETAYSPDFLPGFDFCLGLAYDFGDLSNNFGAIFGIAYTNSFDF